METWMSVEYNFNYRQVNGHHATSHGPVYSEERMTVY